MWRSDLSRGVSENTVKASFPPVVSADTRILVLGSLPGEVSLLRGQYYANDRNHFWRLMADVIGANLPEFTYPDRVAALLGAGVGLWDVVGSAERTGSLDANIRGHSPNDLGGLADTLPALKAIAFNGAKAAEIGARSLGADYRLPLIKLPSSSPAHAVAFERKAAEWARLRPFLGREP
jgi:hypoxanthine-DNA glycosylase